MQSLLNPLNSTIDRFLAFDLLVGVALTVSAWAFGVMPALPQLSLTTGLVALLTVSAGVAVVVYVLQHAATASVALSFSVGMQVGPTAMNTLIGIAGLIVVFGTFRPAAIRAGLRTARETRSAPSPYLVPSDPR